jgi:transcriptional regulator with GAF, ATPase, and Fis domain
MGTSEAVVPFDAAADQQTVLEQLGPDLCRLMAESQADRFPGRLRAMLVRMTEALGADEACISCPRDGSGTVTQFATSDRAAQFMGSMLEGPWFARQLTGGSRIVLPRGAMDLPSEAERERQCVRAAGVQALVACPVKSETATMGTLAVFARRPLMRWATPALDQLEALATLFGRATQWADSADSAVPAHDTPEPVAPRKTSLPIDSDHAIVGESDALRYVLYRVEQVAPTNATVLLLGETGTGKELIAHAIHDHSPRRHRNMVTVNCSALPPTLIESELFGRERGAFTGAHAAQAGRFELANGGTLFLDEIGELPLELQPKLLRVLQEGKIERLGATRTTSVDVRVIAATNRNLAEDVKRGNFRRDLFYRLNVFPITLPALRERREDIAALVRHLVDRLGHQIGRPIHRIPPEVLRTLERHDWPGNVRELENVLQQAIILSHEGTLELGAFNQPSVEAADQPVIQEESQALADIERDHIRRILMNAGWRVEGAAGAAHILGLRPSTLRSRMRKLGIQRPLPVSPRHKA